jgi:hypothetical protein
VSILKSEGVDAPISSFPSRRLFDLAASSKFCLLYRSVLPPPAGLAGVGRGGEPELWVEISIKVAFSKDKVSVLVAISVFFNVNGDVIVHNK